MAYSKENKSMIEMNKNKRDFECIMIPMSELNALSNLK